MEQFPHLKFVQKLTGKPRFHGGGEPHQKSQKNRDNRQGHSDYLRSCTDKIKSDWQKAINSRKLKGLPEVDKEAAPIFLQINPDIINAEFDLESFGIEVISEEDDGFIIGASFDNLQSLEKKINDFIREKYGSGKIAEFWKIYEGNHDAWRPKHILSEELYSQWNNIKDDENYHIEVSVAFAKPFGKEPDPTKLGGLKRHANYIKKQKARDDLLFDRQGHFDRFIEFYGARKSEIVDLNDSFGCEVLISGKGLKDLVLNYQYVFEIAEIDEVSGIKGLDKSFPESELEILPPPENATEIGVIDSGIMENHKFIASAIKGGSKSYIDGVTSTADHVQGGGHGTKVAGAILYPKGISVINSPYTLPCFIRNLRVLNDDNVLLHKYPASLMQTIVYENEECKIFNLSISTHTPYRAKHMSTWAAMIDKLTFEKDVLFLVAAGNIDRIVIQDYIKNGKSYPDYLHENHCRLANPAQSNFALSVGSINQNIFEDEYWNSLGRRNDISAFSRIGAGIWETIKPDLVEYGGGLIVSKNDPPYVKEHELTSPELIRSTLYGGGAAGKDAVGTSFATPKVAHIAAILKQLYPDEGINLIRAFIVQGARLPNDYFFNPTKKSIQYFGYGLPSIERVTKNNDYRVTFYNTGSIQAEEGHLYSLRIPKALRGQGDEYDILIEVTLSYSARIRRTRQKTKSYLSTWLDWTTSKIDEKYEKFKDYILKEINEIKTTYDKEERNKLNSFDWKIKNRSDGSVQDINRSNNSLQKDWTVIKSYELPEEITLAVRGHKGWDKNKTEIPYAITVSLEILGADIPIYEIIRIENQIEIQV